MTKINYGRQRAPVFIRIRDCSLEAAQPAAHLADTSHPSPGDLAVFLPWACDQLLVDTDLVTSKKIVEGLSEKPKGNKLKSTIDVGTKYELNQPPINSSKDFTFNQNDGPQLPRLLLQITCDQYERVTGLQFQNKIPRKLMQLIGLIAKFHEHLTSVAIKQGLDAEVLYELKKVLLLSKITMVHIDNCFVAEGNYYILLDVRCLTNMSLTRCKITDEVACMIAERLKFPMPRFSDLVALSLSNNLIGDVGAKCISDALRANVKLAYLNLAGNRISDTGAQDILNGLKEFALTPEEVVAARRRNAEHASRRHALAMEMLKSDRAKDIERRSEPKKNMKMNPGPTASNKKEKKGLDKEAHVVTADTLSGSDVYDKAIITANKMLGPFNDPHNIKNTVLKEGKYFCPGNNTLCYLNLAYNNLTYFSLKTLLEVLRYQREIHKEPTHGGLINVWLEGNPMPFCKELVEIDSILEKGLSGTAKRSEKKTTRKSRSTDPEKN